MKSLKTLTVLFCVTIFIMSCSKNDETEETLTTNQPHFTAKIDGNDWTADINNSNTHAQIHHGSFLSLSGYTDDLDYGGFLINIRNYNGVGEYKIGVGSTDKSYGRFTSGSFAKNNLKSWNAEESNNSIGTGVLKITSDKDNILKGTFSFDGYNKDDSTTKKITSGSFLLTKVVK